MKLLAVVGAFLLAGSTAACPSQSRSGTTGDPTDDLVDAGGSETFVSATHGVSLSHPRSWRLLEHDLDPAKLNPIALLVLSTFEFPDGGYCAQAPVAALEHLPDDGVLVTIYERLEGDLPGSPVVGFDPKPARFGPWLGSINDDSPLCLDEPKQFSHWFLGFETNGRAFYVLVVFGPRTPPTKQAAAWHVLDSFLAGNRSD